MAWVHGVTACVGVASPWETDPMASKGSAAPTTRGAPHLTAGPRRRLRARRRSALILDMTSSAAPRPPPAEGPSSARRSTSFTRAASAAYRAQAEQRERWTTTSFSARVGRSPSTIAEADSRTCSQRRLTVARSHSCSGSDAVARRSSRPSACTVIVVEDELDRLLAEARQGSRSAFANLIRATNREVHGFCARIAGPAEADDATQETYLALWRALPSFRGESSARTFLFVIARRTALRLARRRHRWSELAESAPPPRSAPSAELGYELEEALASLDTDRRMALVLTGIVGLSYAEAAEVCGVPIGTIRSRVARAREQMSRESSEREAM